MFKSKDVGIVSGNGALCNATLRFRAARRRRPLRAARRAVVSYAQSARESEWAGSTAVQASG